MSFQPTGQTRGFCKGSVVLESLERCDEILTLGCSYQARDNKNKAANWDGFLRVKVISDLLDVDLVRTQTGLSKDEKISYWGSHLFFIDFHRFIYWSWLVFYSSFLSDFFLV